MVAYDDLKAEMEAVQQRTIETKKNQLASALEEEKLFYKEFGSTAGMLKGTLAVGRKKK